METITGSMEMAECIILRTLPLLGSPGIQAKTTHFSSNLVSQVLFLLVRLAKCARCVSPVFSDVNWKFGFI